MRLVSSCQLQVGCSGVVSCNFTTQRKWPTKLVMSLVLLTLASSMCVYMEVSSSRLKSYGICWPQLSSCITFYIYSSQTTLQVCMVSSVMSWEREKKTLSSQKLRKSYWVRLLNAYLYTHALLHLYLHLGSLVKIIPCNIISLFMATLHRDCYMFQTFWTYISSRKTSSLLSL